MIISGPNQPVVFVPQPGGPAGRDGANGADGAAGGNIMAIPSRSGANGSNVSSAALVKTACAVPSRPGEGSADYFPDNTVDLTALTGCPQAGFTDNLGQKYRIVSEQPHNTQQFYDATDGSYDITVQRAVDYHRKQIGINGGGPDAYRGSVPLRCPATHTDYVFNNPVFLSHSIKLFGDGSGDGGPGPAVGCTHIHLNGCSGFVTEHPTTYGLDQVDAGGSHPGVGRAEISDFMITGDGTANQHIVIIRGITTVERIYGRNPGGDVVHGYTGTVDGHDYKGNISTSTIRLVKGEGAQWTTNLRGIDSNVILVEQCQGYQNLRGGFCDENGAGTNKYHLCHATYNGLVSTTGPFVFCSQSGNIYMAAAGATPAELIANAPSGTTAHTAYWKYVGPGGPTASTPAYASGGPWFYGGDYVVLPNAWNVELDCDYSEGGGFSQVNARTLIKGGTDLHLATIGGRRLMQTYDGLSFFADDVPAFCLKNDLQGAVNFTDVNDNMYASLYALVGQALFAFVPQGQGFVVRAGPKGGPFVDVGSIDTGGVKVPAGAGFYINGTEVLSGQMARIADLGAAPTAADFNGLLAAMIGKKLMHV